MNKIVAVIGKGGNGVQAPAGVATAPKAGKAKVELAAVSTLSPAEQAVIHKYLTGKGGFANGVTAVSRWVQVEYTANDETKKGWVRLP